MKQSAMTPKQLDCMLEFSNTECNYCHLLVWSLGSDSAKAGRVTFRVFCDKIDIEIDRPEYSKLWKQAELYIESAHRDYFHAFVVRQGRELLPRLAHSPKNRQDLIELFINWFSTIPEAKEENTMRQETNRLRAAAALCIPNITTVTVAFSDTTQHYTFLCPNDIADKLRTALAEGGATQAFADCNGRIKSVDVIAVHDEPEIDPDANIDYKWVFAIVDTPRLSRLKDEHDTMYEIIRKKRRASVRDTMLASLGIDRNEIVSIASGDKTDK